MPREFLPARQQIYGGALAFTSRAVERLRPRITRIVGELLAAMDARRGGDLIRDFAYPLPVAVIADMLGVPRQDSERFKVWSDELATFIGSALATPDKYARAGTQRRGDGRLFPRGYRRTSRASAG